MSAIILSQSLNRNFTYHKDRPRPRLSCVVCKSAAFGMNFNAITCQSCKAFFRRNAFKPPHLLRCLKTQSCIIDAFSRRNCPACRLAKCLAAGMNRHLIQSVEEKVRRKQNRLEQQQAKILKRFHISKPIRYRPLLTDDDRLLFQHIRQAYENRLEHFHPFDILPELLLNNDYFLQISTLSDLINSRSIAILRLIFFFKFASPQFQMLNADDKVALVKFNIPTLFWLNAALSYNPITNTFCENEQYDLIFDGRNYLHFYGLEIYQKIIKNLCVLHQFIAIDPMIIQLLMLTLLFSHFSSCTSLTEPILWHGNSIRQTQNCYITLLIRILFEKFGQPYADNLLSKLIFTCLNIQNLNRDVGLIESTQIFNEHILTFMKVFLMR